MGATAAVLDCLRDEQLGEMRWAGIGCNRMQQNAIGCKRKPYASNRLFVSGPRRRLHGTTVAPATVGEHGVILIRRWLLSILCTEVARLLRDSFGCAVNVTEFFLARTNENRGRNIRCALKTTCVALST